MKRECSPDDQPNFSIDKRQRFSVRFRQCCVALISSNVPASFFLSLSLFSPLMYINLDLSVVKTKMMMKYVLFLRKPSPLGSPQKRGGKEGWARTKREATLLLTAQGVSACGAWALMLHKPKSSVLQTPSTGSGCLQSGPLGHFARGMKKLSLRHYFRMFLTRAQRATFSVSHKHWKMFFCSGISTYLILLCVTRMHESDVSIILL